MLVCAIGDLVLDVVVRLDTPIVEDTDTYGRSRVGAGGQAANVAAWVCALGARGRLIARHARDPAGTILQVELVRRGVDLVGPVDAEGTGTVVSISRPDGRRTMLSDRGVSQALRADDIRPPWLACDWLHVTGYGLASPDLHAATLRACDLARAAGAGISLDISSSAIVHATGVGRFVEAADAVGASVVFGTEDERELVAGLSAETWAIKRGSSGCAVETAGGMREHPALPVDLVDTTGAGDAFAAGFLLGGPKLALQAAARCVSTMGAMPELRG
jgi:sugar/nucleoside kinase (ribokinase family)